MSGDQLMVNRWRRYGQDRLYVERPDGTKVGWWDLFAAEAHPAVPELREELLAAVDRWITEFSPARASRAQATTVGGEVVDRGPVGSLGPASTDPERHQPAWADLAKNRPGAQARERAVELRRQAPVRTFFARLFGVHNDERAWRIGADGEELVGAQLEMVAARDPRWRNLHAIPVGNRGADIDHLVIGPGGVFTVNTKHHPGGRVWVADDALWVNGTATHYMRNARFEADRASTLLSKALGRPVDVNGLIVMVDTTDPVVTRRHPRVEVLTRRELPRWLLRRQRVLDDGWLTAIHEVARKSTTWSTGR